MSMNGKNVSNSNSSIVSKIQSKIYAAGDKIYDRMMSQTGSRSGKIAFCAMALLGFANSVFAADTSIEASTALGYVFYIILGIGIIFTVIMAISTGFAFKNDSASAKAQLVGTIMIPILIAIVLYIFYQVTGVELSADENAL